MNKHVRAGLGAAFAILFVAVTSEWVSAGPSTWGGAFLGGGIDGGIKGVGDAGRVAFWTGGHELAGSPNFLFSSTGNGAVSVGNGTLPIAGTPLACWIDQNATTNILVANATNGANANAQFQACFAGSGCTDFGQFSSSATFATGIGNKSVLRSDALSTGLWVWDRTGGMTFLEGAEPSPSTIGTATLASGWILQSPITATTQTTTDDQLDIAVTAGGLARFVGTLTSQDLTRTTTWSLPADGGMLPVISDAPAAGAIPVWRGPNNVGVDTNFTDVSGTTDGGLITTRARVWINMLAGQTSNGLNVGGATAIAGNGTAVFVQQTLPGAEQFASFGPGDTGAGVLTIDNANASPGQGNAEIRTNIYTVDGGVSLTITANSGASGDVAAHEMVKVVGRKSSVAALANADVIAFYNLTTRHGHDGPTGTLSWGSADQFTLDSSGTVASSSTIRSSSTTQVGSITLSTGSGTATVFSGAKCVCTDTTANASVRCAVSATTLTATGTGSDVINYLCM